MALNLKKLAANALPIVGGIGGGVAGTFVAPGAGTAVGGAAGSGFGEFLRQKLLGEQVNLGRIAGESALGAIPGGIAKGAQVAKAAKVGKAAGLQAALREQALKELTHQEKRTLSEFGEYGLRKFQPKDLNATIRGARGVGSRLGVDVTSGSPADIARRIEAAILESERLQGMGGALRQSEIPNMADQIYKRARPGALVKTRR